MIGVFLSKGKEEWSDKYGSSGVDMSKTKVFVTFLYALWPAPKFLLSDTLYVTGGINLNVENCLNQFYLAECFFFLLKTPVTVSRPLPAKKSAIHNVMWLLSPVLGGFILLSVSSGSASILNETVLLT